MRVLIIAHGHPALSAGGAERAAYSLFEHMKRHPAVSAAMFAARATPDQIGHSAQMGLFRGRRDEALVATPPVEWPSMMSLDYNELRRTVEDLLAWTKPDVVHVHHFSLWSLDLLEILFQMDIPIVFTFHEYMAICQNLGQMIKVDRRLCETASPSECHACFPDYTPGQFFLREQVFRNYLSYCDFFVAPSRFLRERYTSWGVDPDVIDVIENPISPTMLDRFSTAASDWLSHAPEAAAPGSRRVRMGFFGQVNKFKGVDVLLRAVSMLPPEVRSQIEIGIHGANLDQQEDAFKAEIATLLAATGDVVSFLGAYDNQRVPELMKGYDWIVMPSVWWENSPVVIQEAQLIGKPILCSRIGGMAEKVTEDVNGRYFDPGNPTDLMRHITRIVAEPQPLTFNPGTQIGEHLDAVERHVEIYRRVARPRLARARA